MFNKPLQQQYGRQRKPETRKGLFNPLYEFLRKLNYRYTSIPSVFSLAKKLNLLLKHRTVVTSRFGHVLSDSVSGQSRGVI